jgi:hypothetical protein
VKSPESTTWPWRTATNPFGVEGIDGASTVGSEDDMLLHQDPIGSTVRLTPIGRTVLTFAETRMLSLKL